MRKTQANRRQPDYSGPQLFQDTSYPGYMDHQGFNQAGYESPPPQPGTVPFQMPGGQFLQDPMVANMAMQYGSSVMGHGSQVVQQNISKYVSTSRLKYYFAVDNMYVGKKLLLLLFPYSQLNWAVQYDQENQPVAPRYDVNAPDLYIPVMALVTYILTAGLALGTQNRFTPEHLGILTSTALGWLVLEILILMLTLYLLYIETSLRYLDLIAYSGYKYVGMILVLVCGLLLQRTGYYISLLWCSSSLAFFLIRTLKLQILPNMGPGDSYSYGNKRRVYMLLVIALIQPLVMWWLTSSVLFSRK